MPRTATGHEPQLHTFPTSVLIPVLQDVYVHDPDNAIRWRAFDAILNVPDFDHVQFLIEEMERTQAETPDKTGKLSVLCDELGDFPDPRTVAKLCALLLEHPSPNIRCKAAVFLSYMRDERAIPALEHARDHDTGEDFEGRRIAKIAQRALEQIRARDTH
jgi:HEAT repeat protein